MMRKGQINRVGNVTRRQALTAAAGMLGATLAMRKSGLVAEERANVCILTPEATQGPFYFDPRLVRTNIAEGKTGVPLKLVLQVVEAGNCALLHGARVDVWHADGLGVYSGYARQETGSAQGETFLRGTQFTDADGRVQFDTIYPGWYPGRTPHIHFKVLLDDTDLVTGQLYFPDDVTTRIYAAHQPYRTRSEDRDTMNADDFIFRRQGGEATLTDVIEDGDAYRLALVIGIARR